MSDLKSQKKRRRRKPKATTKVDVATATSTPAHSANLDAKLESFSHDSPISAHPVDINSKPMILETSTASLPATDGMLISPSSQSQSACSDSSDDTDSDSKDTEPEVDLLSCTEVVYEKRDGTHGVSYCDSSSKYQWTPVVG